jgi:hypothetical protein
MNADISLFAILGIAVGSQIRALGCAHHNVCLAAFDKPRRCGIDGVRGAACGLNALGEEPNRAAALEGTEHVFDAHDIGLVQIFRNDTKGNEEAVKPFFEDVLKAANNVDILAAKAVNGVEKLKTRRVRGEQNGRLILDGFGIVIVTEIHLVVPVYHAHDPHTDGHEKLVRLFDFSVYQVCF